MPHSDAVRDMHGGQMDGFIASLKPREGYCWTIPDQPQCADKIGPEGQPDVMSTLPRAADPELLGLCRPLRAAGRDVRAVDSWTLPSHLFLVSGWSAYCSDPTDPMSCSQRHQPQGRTPVGVRPAPDLCVDRHHLAARRAAACRGGSTSAITRAGSSPRATTRRGGLRHGLQPQRAARLHEFWDCERADGVQDNMRPVDDYLASAADGSLPPCRGSRRRRHQRAPRSKSTIETGMAYVTRLVNAVMQGPDWDSTAIFLTWDDWGGFYDHVEAAAGRRQRVRVARARPRDQPVHEARLHRPHDACRSTRTCS